MKQGASFHRAGQLDHAIARYKRAVSLDINHAEAHFCLGNVLRDRGKLEDAITCYKNALILCHDYMEAWNNLGMVLRDSGKLGQSVLVLQNALKRDPSNARIISNLVHFLNYHTPNVETQGVHAKTQTLLQQNTQTDLGDPKITEETVQRLYHTCHDALESCQLNDESFPSQLFRGVTNRSWKMARAGGCAQHRIVFDAFKAIPEDCFSCYKISVEPKTVVDLFKMMVVFHRISLPNDNSRKCMVELRPEISGAYKGLVYCQSLEEGNDVLNRVQRVIQDEISATIAISLKRGCSEYKAAYPDYDVWKDGVPVMQYNDAWKKHETYVDKNLLRRITPPMSTTHNHAGLTLRDALIMRTWLAYAATIGDDSYLKIAPGPVQKLPNVNR